MNKLLAFCLIGICAASCETVENTFPAIHPASTVDSATTLNAARSVRWGVTNGTLRQGEGVSMAPIYGDNTILVITPIDFDQLEEGMIVAYLNKWGDQIVHQLVKREGKRWVAKGLNNTRADAEAVTPKNLIGVVYAVFNSNNTSKGSHNRI